MEGVRDCGPLPDPSLLSPPPDEDDQSVSADPRQSYQAVNDGEDQQHSFRGSHKVRPVTGYNLGLGQISMFYIFLGELNPQDWCQPVTCGYGGDRASLKYPIFYLI